MLTEAVLFVVLLLVTAAVVKGGFAFTILYLFLGIYLISLVWTRQPRTPTLAWEPAVQAASYTAQVATDPQFTVVVFDVATTSTGVTVNPALLTGTVYYWRVGAANGCGAGPWSPTYSFTTVFQGVYFTEQFTGDFDLAYHQLTFTPIAGPEHYHVCGGAATALPVDPAGGTPITLADNDAKRVYLSGSRTVQLYNIGYTSICVGSNGYLTFTGADTNYTPTLSHHFLVPRVAACYDNLNPYPGGGVSWQQLDDSAVVSYLNIPEHDTGILNTFQIQMFFDGPIRITWLNMGAGSSIVGLSAGGGMPADFLETNLSESGSCLTPADMNCDGLRNAFDIDPFILALVDPAAYEAAFPLCYYRNADCNGDRLVNAFDIDAFITLLTGP